MKARISNKEIEYIKNKVAQYGNVSIYYGQLSLSVLEKLNRQFKVTKQHFVYYHFEKLNK